MAKSRKKKYWSGEVTKRSQALKREGIFASKDPQKIARFLKRRAQKKKGKKGSFQSAMSMLNFYINRAGANLGKSQRKVLDQAKEELRKLYKRKK